MDNLDGYVECQECGHAIEGHDTKSCHVEGCPCVERWTLAEIRRVRVREGLPATIKEYRP